MNVPIFIDTSRRDCFAPEALGQFAHGLAGLPPEEVRKSKVLFIKNAISAYEAVAGRAQSPTNRRRGSFLKIITLGLIDIAAINVSQLKLMSDRIKNAIEVWRDDIQGEVFQFDGETFSL